MASNEVGVDVLAVLDDMASTVQLVSNEHRAWHARIVESRAAVAELIEECERLCDVADGMKRNADGMSRKSPIALTLRTAAANILSLRNALAHVGGAA